jgi:hypothetical protein
MHSPISPLGWIFVSYFLLSIVGPGLALPIENEEPMLISSPNSSNARYLIPNGKNSPSPKTDPKTGPKNEAKKEPKKEPNTTPPGRYMIPTKSIPKKTNNIPVSPAKEVTPSKKPSATVDNGCDSGKLCPSTNPEANHSTISECAGKDSSCPSQNDGVMPTKDTTDKDTTPGTPPANQTPGTDTSENDGKDVEENEEEDVEEEDGEEEKIPDGQVPPPAGKQPSGNLPNISANPIPRSTGPLPDPIVPPAKIPAPHAVIPSQFPPPPATINPSGLQPSLPTLPRKPIVPPNYKDMVSLVDLRKYFREFFQHSKNDIRHIFKGFGKVATNLAKLPQTAVQHKYRKTLEGARQQVVRFIATMQEFNKEAKNETRDKLMKYAHELREQSRKLNQEIGEAILICTTLTTDMKAHGFQAMEELTNLLTVDINELVSQATLDKLAKCQGFLTWLLTQTRVQQGQAQSAFSNSDETLETAYVHLHIDQAGNQGKTGISS